MASQKNKPMYGEADYLRHCGNPLTPQVARSGFRRDFARLMHSPVFRRLQGKMQLFPGYDSDFFRNRLTHSLEVAQVAKSLALRFNENLPAEQHIDTDLIEFAGLAHDLGHPPFGHTGEHALDVCMREYGGFEGNAQTLRILARLEKKTFVNSVAKLTVSNDSRVGLDLCARSIAAILKYDSVIPKSRGMEADLAKGYYEHEADYVAEVKKSVLDAYTKTVIPAKFKTIECSIMDIADDIAYSTYDLEDSLKAEFVSPLDFLSPPVAVLERVSVEVTRALRKSGDSSIKFTVQDVLDTLYSIVEEIAPLSLSNGKPFKKEKLRARDQAMITVARDAQRNGYARVAITSSLIDEFINGVTLALNKECPPLSTVKVDPKILRKIEVLKNFNFAFTIMSPRVRLMSYRGEEIVSSIFTALRSKEKSGYEILPEDVRALWDSADGDEAMQARVICDFIAGMTDRYATDFYARLRSENPRSIFTPH